MSLTAIVTAHRESPHSILRCLAAQTVPPKQVLVGISEVPILVEVPSAPFSTVLVHSPDEKDFGYRKRNRLIDIAVGDFTGFFCHDDSYDGDYIEKMLDAADKTRADVVYCSWNDIPNCTFNACSSTLGNFIVRTSLLQEVGGFPEHENEGLRDAALIEKLRSVVSSIARVNVMLYYHNVPYIRGTRVSVWGKEQEEHG